jgi:CheY-like chemotaxis protein
MQGSSEVDYQPDGVCFYMEVPETALVLGPEPTSASGGTDVAIGASANAPRILLVEDDALVAHVLEEAVRALGWTPVGPVGRVEAAMVLALIEAGTLQGAVLDINIDDAKVWPVAEVLQNQGVPFLFATAYERNRKVLPERFAGVSVLSKPFVEQQLMDTLLWLVADKRSEHNGHNTFRA